MFIWLDLNTAKFNLNHWRLIRRTVGCVAALDLGDHGFDSKGPARTWKGFCYVSFDKGYCCISNLHSKSHTQRSKLTRSLTSRSQTTEQFNDLHTRHSWDLYTNLLWSCSLDSNMSCFVVEEGRSVNLVLS